MAARNTLWPEHFSRAMPAPRYQNEDPRSLADALAAAQEARHGDLLEIDQECYRPPLAPTLFLYRRSPKEHRLAVLSALEPDDSSAVWQTLAAAAREAYRAGDFGLLGLLAFRLDRALEPRWSDAGGAVPLSPPQAAVELAAAFRRALDDAHAAVTPSGYARAAYAYLQLLPPGTVLPPCVWESESADDAAWPRWPLLRWFLRPESSLWAAAPEQIREGLQQLKLPQLPTLLARLPRTTASAPPAESQTQANPFEELAGGLAEDPVDVLETPPDEPKPVEQKLRRRPPPRDELLLDDPEPTRRRRRRQGLGARVAAVASACVSWFGRFTGKARQPARKATKAGGKR